MMEFDQMVATWKSQDDKPLYGVNRDLLRLALQHEEANLRRELRLEQWTTYVTGTAMAALAGGILWWFFDRRGSGMHLATAAIGLVAFMLWVSALWLSRRRQALRDRDFGNTLREEIRRNLSLVDYQLSQVGRWSTATLWAAPVILGSVLTFWLIMEINDNTDFWFEAAFIMFIVASSVMTTYGTSRKTRRRLLPRRQRLAELLAMIEMP
jgi:hypothetical protein